MKRRQVPVEALINLQQRLDTFPNRSAARRELVKQTARSYGISDSNLYRMLRERKRPATTHRSDHGQPRHLSTAEMEKYCEIIAAMKIRTLNKKGRHISTGRAIELLEEHGVHTPESFVRPPRGVLKKATVNRFLKVFGYDLDTLTREPPAVRFQAEFSNDCWHFDLSPSDLKHLEKPPAWVEPGRGNPTLMLYSTVDDRSGTSYQEYHCVYGEDTEAALRFIFNAMSRKSIENFPFWGIPKKLYMDNGPIAKSKIFLNVMQYLGVEVITHLPAGSHGRRTTARSKGKVERPFRTVKEAYETLYHFHQPETKEEANRWLHNYLVTYNNQEHRSENHSRFEDWLKNQPPEGIREMCSWERFCTFAREPEKRTVDGTARITVDGTSYEVAPDLAGETVILWWGLFDTQLFVELNEEKFGPYYPVGEPVSFNQFRRFKKTRYEERGERISALAKKLELPRSALEGVQDLEFSLSERENYAPATSIAFKDPDPFQEFTYPDVLSAKRAIAEYIGQPLTKLLPEQREFICALLEETLSKKAIVEQIDIYFFPSRRTRFLEMTTIEEKDKYVN